MLLSAGMYAGRLSGSVTAPASGGKLHKKDRYRTAEQIMRQHI